MKSFILGLLVLSSCGYTSRDNDVVGQVKKVVKVTPIICPDFKVLDLSLGVMRNGVGSMSTEDEIFYVESAEDFKTLTNAANAGQLVRIKYDVARVRFCRPEHEVLSVEVLK